MDLWVSFQPCDFSLDLQMILPMVSCARLLHTIRKPQREDDLAHGTSRWPFCPDGFRIPEGFGMVNQRDDTSRCHTPREVFETFRRHFGLYEEALNAMLLALLKVGRLIEGNDDAATFDDGIGVCKRLPSHQVEQHIDRLNHIFKPLLREVDDAIS